jgi:hypothetical protein
MSCSAHCLAAKVDYILTLMRGEKIARETVSSYFNLLNHLERETNIQGKTIRKNKNN